MPSINKNWKPHRYRSGTVRKLPFQRLVREIAKDFKVTIFLYFLEWMLDYSLVVFVSSGIETIFNGLGRNNDGENSYLGSEVTIFSTIGRPLGRKKPFAFHVKKRKRVSRLVLDEQGLAQAHRYVLFNSDKDERQPGWLTVKHAKLRDLFDMGDASSFEKDEEPEQLGLDDSVDTSISSWIRNDVGADGFDVTPDMENENVEEDPINEQNREAIF
ncbi:hypothetical protein V6N13_064167 [Hibiscus sabdariffa]